MGGDARRAIATAAATPLVRTYTAYLKAANDYFGPLTNFFNQGFHVLYTNGYIGRERSSKRKEELVAMLKGFGINTDFAHLSVGNLNDSFKALPLFQKSFREDLSAFVHAERLKNVERKEQELNAGLWAIWYQFATHPQRTCWHAAEARSIAVVNHVIEKFTTALSDSLKAFETEGWSGVILSDTIQWEDLPALWIALNIDEPFDVFHALETLVKALKESYNCVKLGSLEQFVIDRAWPNLVIIPIIRGRCVSKGVWRLPSYYFYFFEDDELFTPERAWTLVPVEPDVAVWQELGLKVFASLLTEQVEALQQSITELFLLADHLSDFLNFPSELGDKGLGVLQLYTSTKEVEISNAWTRLVANWTHLVNTLPSDEELSQRPYLQLVSEVLAELRGVIFLSEQLGQPFEVDLKGLDAWAERLQSKMILVELLKYLYAADSSSASSSRPPVQTPSG